MFRKLVAQKLRLVATLLDGREMIDLSWHERNVMAMNRYIGTAERYIIALEDLLKQVSPATVESLRREHGRFDTKPLRDAGAWKMN